MVREILKNEEHMIFELCKQDPIINCYILSDIKTLGVEHPSLKVFGDFEDGKLNSVLMAFQRYLMFYTDKPFISVDYIEIIEKLNPYSVSGNRHSIQLIQKQIEYKKSEEFQLAVLQGSVKKSNLKESYSIREIDSKEEIKQLYDLLINVTEFNVSSLTEEEFLEEKRLIHLAGTTYGLYDQENQLISTATAMSETEDYAVINGVATKAEYQNQGLATMVIEHLLDEYVNKKQKGLILYYNNPAAATIYLKKGFVPVKEWISVTF